MNVHLYLSKVEMLPEYLQREVVDFIDYLVSKQNKKNPTIIGTDFSEDEMGKNIEVSSVNDSEADYLTEKELNYYLKLKDEH